MSEIFNIRPVSVGLDTPILQLFIYISGYLDVRKISEMMVFRTFVGPLLILEFFDHLNAINYQNDVTKTKKVKIYRWTYTNTWTCRFAAGKTIIILTEYVYFQSSNITIMPCSKHLGSCQSRIPTFTKLLWIPLKPGIVIGPNWKTGLGSRHIRNIRGLELDILFV